VDYPTFVATSATHLVPLVAVITIDGTVIGADITPIATSIFDIATAVSAVFLTGIAPTSVALGTALTP